MVAGFAEVIESEATLVALARFELTISTRSPAHLLTRQVGCILNIYIMCGAKTLLRQVDYSRVLRYFERGSFFARLACVLGRYGTYGDFGILIKKNAPAFRASSAPFNSSHREMHSFVFSGLGQEQLCTVTQMRAIFAQFVHSRSVDRWEESRKLQ
jgi:hypothetical protein